MPRPNSLPSTISSLSIVVPEEARSTLFYTAVEGFASLEWRRLLQHLENLESLAVPPPYAVLPMQVVILSSSDFTMVCPRLQRVSIATDTPVDEVHDEQLKRITKFVEARHDAGFTLSSLDVDVSVAMPISDQARADHTKTWDASVGEVVFFVRF